MYRSKSDRKHHKIVAEHHITKNWYKPEQVQPRYREPLSELERKVREVEMVDWQGEKYTVALRHHKRSDILLERDDKFDDGYFENKSNRSQVFSREREYYKKLQYQKRLSNYNDIRRGKNTNYKTEIDDDYSEYLENKYDYWDIIDREYWYSNDEWIDMCTYSHKDEQTGEIVYEFTGVHTSDYCDDWYMNDHDDDVDCDRFNDDLINDEYRV